MATLTPAYGRDYKSKKAAIADWNAGRDFIYLNPASRDNGRYANKESLVGTGTHQLRYKRLTQVCIVKA